jgi:NOL1/NOP2/fmu family ribosome biogenesis protein
VEIYSHSRKQWCPGQIAELEPDDEENQVLVRFSPPDNDGDEYEFQKVLALDDEDLRLLDKQDGAKVEDPVEVYSHSRKLWCPGEIAELEPDGAENHVLVRFSLPDSDADEYEFQKVLALDDEDLRLLNNQGGGEQKRHQKKFPRVLVGCPVEVYSNGMEQWCGGEIVELAPNGNKNHVMVRFGAPDSDEYGFKKVLAIDAEELRFLSDEDRSDDASGFTVGAPVEVYSNSMAQWCRGEIAELAPDDIQHHVLVRFGLPGSEERNLEKVLSDDDSELRPLAEQDGGAEGHQHQKQSSRVSVGDPIEVYSHGMKTWCRGVIATLEPNGHANHVLVRFGAPDSDEHDLKKVLSIDNKDLRLLTKQDDGGQSKQHRDISDIDATGLALEAKSLWESVESKEAQRDQERKKAMDWRDKCDSEHKDVTDMKAQVLHGQEEAEFNRGRAKQISHDIRHVKEELRAEQTNCADEERAAKQKVQQRRVELAEEKKALKAARADTQKVSEELERTRGAWCPRRRQPRQQGQQAGVRPTRETDGQWR